MKLRPTGPVPAAVFLLSLLLVAGCGSGAGFSSLGPRFSPIDGKVAAMQNRSAGGSVASGPDLHCKAGRGTAHFGKKWLGYSETVFGLAAQERVNVVLEARKGKGSLSIQAFFDKEGQRLLFCPVVDGPPTTRVACTSIYALDDDLQMGIKRTFDIPNALRGGSITCAYKDKNLKKL